MKSPQATNIFRFINFLLQNVKFQKRVWNMSDNEKISASRQFAVKLCPKAFERYNHKKRKVDFSEKMNHVESNADLPNQDVFDAMLKDIYECLELSLRALILNAPGPEALLIGMIPGNLCIALLKKEPVHLCRMYARNAIVGQAINLKKTVHAYMERWLEHQSRFKNELENNRKLSNSENKENSNGLGQTEEPQLVQPMSEYEKLVFVDCTGMVAMLYVFKLDFLKAYDYWRFFFLEMNSLTQSKTKIVQEIRFLWYHVINYQCKPILGFQHSLEGYKIMYNIDPDSEITSKALISLSLFQAQVGNYSDAMTSYNWAHRRKHESGSKNLLFFQVVDKFSVEFILASASTNEAEKKEWKSRFVQTTNEIMNLFSTTIILEVKYNTLYYMRNY